MSDEERCAARGLWDELHAQWTKAGARNRWLAENQDAPDWPELDEKAARSDVKFGRLRNELAEFCGVDVESICHLLAPARGAR